MSTITVELPSELRLRLERIANEFGISISDLLVDAANKLSQADTLEDLKAKARSRDTRSGFERVLAAVPAVTPEHPSDLID